MWVTDRPGGKWAGAAPYVRGSPWVFELERWLLRLCGRWRCRDLWLGSVCAVSTKCVDRSGSGQSLTRVPDTPRDRVFLPGLDWNPPPIDNQGVATLHYREVLVVVVDVRR